MDRTVSAQRISWFNQQRQLKLLNLKPTYQRNPVFAYADGVIAVDARIVIG